MSPAFPFISLSALYSLLLHFIQLIIPAPPFYTLAFQEKERRKSERRKKRRKEGREEEIETAEERESDEKGEKEE